MNQENFDRIALDNLQPGESVQLVLKRHWIVFVYTGLHLLFLVISSVVLLSFHSVVVTLIPSALYSIFLVVYWFAYLLYVYVGWINNELDLFIITNRRVIGIEQLSFLNRTVSECALDDVQEVNAQTKGLLANLLNFGTITIHTASEKSDFNMNIVPDALENARNILNVVNTNKARKSKVVAPETPVETAE